MSDYESHSGKVRLAIPNENENFEQQCKRLWIENGFSIDEYQEPNDLFGMFVDTADKYLNVNGKIWEIVEHIEDPDEDMYCNLHDNHDGTFTFRTRFYNGGTDMREMITEELEKL